MTQTDQNTPLDRAKLNFETAKTPWAELQRVFAMGKVVYVSPELDLVDVAHQCAQDNRNTFEAWMSTGQVFVATDQQARQWFETNAMVWAVVVKPWVLVQDVVNP